jgi:uncharacterized protein
LAKPHPQARKNRLALEKSPYLLKHSSNPVDWYTWNDEALRRAKNDNKPIFLSIGYSTCHWCTVMEKESFEDPHIAAIINKNFIPIKVDREERPEVDAYYMAAVQAMTGGGGWPLTVFLTPDLKPFYGGTYYPPVPRYGMPSFAQVLEFVARVWVEKRDEVVENAGQIAKAISDEGKPREATELGARMLDEGYSAMVAVFDPEYGGFGGPPKFPMPLTSAFLLRYHFRTGKDLALRGPSRTLDGIMAGGIRDHVGGGFHRYSTDRTWLVPHFEKMLYDNALLAKLFVEAHLATGRSDYAEVARETLSWMLREMRDEGGGFYSAQDADTEEGEGRYYTWTPDEVAEVLGSDAPEFDGVYGVTRTGNFEGRSILHLDAGTAAKPPEKLARWKSLLYLARTKRPRPATDKKVLTSWNGLAVSAMAFAGSALGQQELVRAAEEAADFVLENCSRDGRLLRRYAGGEAALDGTLEDYAFFVQGLLDLFEATADPRWLRESVRLEKVMEVDFEDKRNGGFFLTVDAQPARLKEGYDGPTPSGNSVAAVDLVRLSELTGEVEMKERARRVVGYFAKDIEQQPASHANMMVALDLLVNGVREVVITAETAAAARRMKRAVEEKFLPDKVVLVATSQSFAELSKQTSLLEGREPGKKARAYVCKNFSCKLPADSVEALRAQLGAAEG